MEVVYTANFQPDLLLGSYRIGEPVIALTALLVSAVGFYCWARLKTEAGMDNARRLGRIFFILTAISTFLGGILGHAFLYAIPFAWKLPGWTLGMIAVSALQQASITRLQEADSRFSGPWLTRMNIGALTLGLWFVSSTLWFPAVEIHAAFAILGTVLPVEIYLKNKRQDPGSKWMLLGVFSLVAGVIPHVFKWSLGIWFSFFDIGHLFMCVALYYFMLAFEKKPIKNISQEAVEA